jgi:hypothetical protein
MWWALEVVPWAQRGKVCIPLLEVWMDACYLEILGPSVSVPCVAAVAHTHAPELSSRSLSLRTDQAPARKFRVGMGLV